MYGMTSFLIQSIVSCLLMENRLRNLSAASIFSHFLESGNENFPPPKIPEEEKPKKSKCCKCCWSNSEKKKRCCGCCSCAKKSKKLSGAYTRRDSDLTSDDEEPPSEDESSPSSSYWCCFSWFRRSKRNKSRVMPEEVEWKEDLGRVSHVPSGFKDWLHQTYRQDRKPPAKIRKEKMRARRAWNQSVSHLALQAAKDRGSIISLQGFNESKMHIIDKILMDISDWNFDSFELEEKTDKHSLAFIVREIFKRHDFIRKFRIKIPALKNFVKALEAGYTMHGNPYHNNRHAADVTQTVHAILESHPGVYKAFTELELFALIFAAIIHDLAHPGTTNNFHINAQTQLALIYNDRNVLENHHLSSAFLIVKNQACNILENLKTDEFKEFRELVIELVLATDMVSHFQNLKTVRSFLKAGEWDGTSHKVISNSLSLILHCADIGNPAKPWSIHKQCAEAVLAEFLAQGVKERSLKIPVSPLCDPKDQTAVTQITFIEVIVQPTFEALGDLLEMILASRPKDKSAPPPPPVQVQRRLTTEEAERRPSAHNDGARGQRLSVFSNLPLFSKTGRVSKDDAHDRPWVFNLAANIEEWRKIKELESPSPTPTGQRRTTLSKNQMRKSSEMYNKSGAKPSQVAPSR